MTRTGRRAWPLLPGMGYQPAENYRWFHQQKANWSGRQQARNS
jgi:hypothetical protein